MIEFTVGIFIGAAIMSIAIAIMAIIRKEREERKNGGINDSNTIHFYHLHDVFVDGIHVPEGKGKKKGKDKGKTGRKNNRPDRKEGEKGKK